MANVLPTKFDCIDLRLLLQNAEDMASGCINRKIKLATRTLRTTSGFIHLLLVGPGRSGTLGSFVKDITVSTVESYSSKVAGCRWL